MLYQPTFPSPYLETIDVENPTGNIFKCLINPKNKVVGYKMSILSNLDNSICCQIKGSLEEIDNSMVQKKSYSVDGGTTWVEFETIPEEDSVLPVIGNYSDESWLQVLIPSDVDLGLSNNSDYKWNITLQEENPNVKVFTATFYNSTTKNGTDSVCYLNKIEGIETTIMYVKYKNAVKQIVDIYDSNGSYTQLYLDSSFDSITKGDSCEILTVCLTSYDYYFRARKTPVVTFEVPDTINSSSNIFTANVDRNNIASYKFELYLGADLIDTSENMYSNDISYTYDGFISGNQYSIKLTVITEDDEAIIEERNFNISYNVSQSTILVNTKIDNEINGIYLDFSSQMSILGTISDNTDVVYKKYKNPNDETPDSENSIHLERKQSLYWNSINNVNDLVIPNDSTTIIHWHGDLGFNNKIVELSNNRLITEKVTIGYNSKEFYYKIGAKDMEYYTPYTNGYANAIAGRDEFSVGGQIKTYSRVGGVTQVSIPLTDKVQSGMYISILGERKLITEVVNETDTILTLESPFSVDILSGENYYIYDELRCYIFSDEDVPEGTDIFVENDMGYNYWWLIVILPNEVKFIKTKRYTDTVVSE